MNRRVMIALVLLLAVGSAAGQESRKDTPAAEPAVREPALRDELLARQKQDQDARAGYLKMLGAHGIRPEDGEPRFTDRDLAKRATEQAAKMAEVDRQNTEWLEKVVDTYGWPGRALVGADAAGSAWLLVQHADANVPFQNRCLKLMKAAPSGDVRPQHIAYLTDRVLVREGKAQVYGTQARGQGSDWKLLPIADEANVDKRRAEVGLAEYVKLLHGQNDRKAVGQRAPQGTGEAIARFTPPDDIQFQTRDIVSEGTRMTAEVFSLKTLAGKKLPAIILCHGWGGLALHLRPEAIAFARAGYLAVAFDYRGWGASDGRLISTGPLAAGTRPARFTAEVIEIREVVDPLDQTTDLQNAIHWVVGEPQCDAGRIGLWGSSYSGGHVVYVAARDPRIKALVSQVPALDSRWVVATPAEREVTSREASRRARGEAGYPPPGQRVIMGLLGAPIRERMINYAPVDDVDKASRCAMLFIVAEKEEYFNNKDHALKAYDRAKGPKKLITIPGINHYGIYGPGRPRAQKLAVDWFDEQLKGRSDAAVP
jgi:dienelactone hydrolase